MSKHVIKFFPAQHAFTISPAPKSGFKSIGDQLNFEWIFEDGARLEVEWDQHSGVVTEPCLVFKPLSNSHRQSPIGNSGGGDVKGNNFFITSQSNFIEIKMGKDGHHWGFDFKCKLDDKEYTVDPEMRIGTGENS